jgi:hypothetical protein
MSDFPAMFRVRQHFARPRVEDVSGTVARQLAPLMQGRVQPGDAVAITAGSRGIANYAVILRAAVDYTRSLGARPTIVPAMGSHGGATAEGQTQLLADFGVTAQTMGCPIDADMQTVVLGQTELGFPIYFAAVAHAAQHVLVVNRVKSHTDFDGEFQSGLIKMMMIGLGNLAGATTYHRAILDHGFDRIARSVGPFVLDRCPILGGLALIENAYGETAQIEAVCAAEILTREPQLLARSKQLMGKLPFDRANLLIIDQIGKNISGTGMDTNIVGRKRADHAASEHEWPKIQRIYVRSLTPQTHGNAAGLGIAEFCHRHLLEQMNVETTRINCLTSGRISLAMLPLDFPTDRAAIAAALRTIGLTEPEQAKVMWIKNTASLEDVICSRAYWGEAQSRDDLEVMTEPKSPEFDERGELPSHEASEGR